MPEILPIDIKLKRGQTFLSLILALAIFGILAHAIFTLTTTSFNFIGLSRARITARHLAQERIELIRNLKYDDVGTLGGIPAGPITQSEKILRNGLSFLVETSIIYIDDPFDETTPDDLLPTDYKRVRVEVSWEGLARSGKNPIILVTDISPKGVETTIGGGTLSILVFDANALPIMQASVHIFADSLDPIVDITTETNENGRIILPGTPACISCYQITVTREGYSSERTYSITEVANPNKPHVSVVEGEQTEVSFAIDKVSRIKADTLSDRELDFDPLGDITFRLRGQKTIGTDVNDLPVYKFDEQFTTNNSGKVTIPDLEWDNYELFIPSGTPYDIAGTNPLTPISLLPDTNLDLAISLTNQTNHRLLLVITEPVQTPVASASATVSDGGGVEETKLSGIEGDPDFGQAFFSNLSETTYSIDATASGYLDFNGSVDVSGYTKENIILIPE